MESEAQMNAVTPKKRELDAQSHTQTPRRSARKSVMPLQDYEQIVNQRRVLRSTKKETKEDERGNDVTEEQEKVKWTPAKVGRVSEKRGRKGRKSSRRPTMEVDRTTVISDKDAVDFGLELIKDDKNETPLDNKEAEHKEKPGNDKTDADKVIIGEELAIDKEQMDTNEVIAIADNSSLGDPTMEADRTIVISDKDAVDFGLELIKYDKNEPPLDSKEMGNKEKPVNDKTDADEVIVGEELAIDEDKMDTNEVIAIADDSAFDDEIESNEVIAETSAFVKDGMNADEVVDEKLALDEDGMNTDDVNVAKKLANDDILDSSDCIIVSPNDNDESLKMFVDSDSDELEKLHVSDDNIRHDLSPKIPTVIITDMENIEHQTCINASLPVVAVTPNKSDQTKVTASPTSVVKQQVEAKIDIASPQLSATMPLVAMEPVEIVLRSIRKRSLSLCIGDVDQTRKKRNVTFHSPANQTTVIESFDFEIAQSIKKKAELDDSINQSDNVTRRRKRSLSFSDASILVSKPSIRKGTPKKGDKTPIKDTANSAAGAIAKRTRLPNFAAIHEKQFNKMENLVDHMARKAERAKTISSASKVYPFQRATPSKDSLQQKATPSKNLLNQSRKREDGEKTKATKRIDWTTPKKTAPDGPISKKLAIIKPLPSNTSTIKTSTSQIKSKTTSNTSTIKSNLPVTKLNKPNNINKTEQPKTAISVFGASTSIPPPSKSTTLPPASMSSTLLSSTLCKEREDKMATRRQRHIEMFKGRSATTTPKSETILRGVRSNRRFELQMQHRRNMEKN